MVMSKTVGGRSSTRPGRDPRSWKPWPRGSTFKQGAGRPGGFLADTRLSQDLTGREVNQAKKVGCSVGQAHGAGHKQEQRKTHLGFIPRAPRNHGLHLQQPQTPARTALREPGRGGGSPWVTACTGGQRVSDRSIRMPRRAGSGLGRA